MSETDQVELRERLKSQVMATPAALLLPHHRRDALFFLQPHHDFLGAACAIGSDNAAAVKELVDSGVLYRPSLAELSDLCAEPERKLQYVILQPYVVAQVILEDLASTESRKLS